MVVTILEAHVALDRWSVLRNAYTSGLDNLPPQMVETFLLQSTSDQSLWQIVSVWKSREALNEMRNSGETPAGVVMFRSAGAEPTLSILNVSAFAP